MYRKSEASARDPGVPVEDEVVGAVTHPPVIALTCRCNSAQQESTHATDFTWQESMDENPGGMDPLGIVKV